MMGNPKVGFIQIPTTWVNRTSGLDPGIVDSAASVYFADPDSEYPSPTIGSFAFSKGIQMSVQPTSYEELATAMAGSYRSSDAYGDVEAGAITLNGHKAILITTTMPADNLQVCCIVIDRDGDGHAAVVLWCNCGASEAQANDESVRDPVGHFLKTVDECTEAEFVLPQLGDAHRVPTPSVRTGTFVGSAGMKEAELAQAGCHVASVDARLGSGALGVDPLSLQR